MEMVLKRLFLTFFLNMVHRNHRNIDNWFDCDNISRVPRLTAGIYAVTKILSPKYVLVPNNCCPNVVYGIVLAGSEPVFCEVNKERCSLDEHSCRDLMDRYEVEMVILVHMYGLYVDRDIIHSLCRQHGAFIFEDGGLWFPPRSGYTVLENSCLGLSFGKKKIFDLGGGGLIISSNSEMAAEVDRVIESLPGIPNQISDYGAEYYRVVGGDGLPKENGFDCTYLAKKYERYWLGRSKPANDHIVDHLWVESEKARRDELVGCYKEILSGFENIKFFVTHKLDMPWRFSFLHKDARMFASKLRKEDVQISHWYPPLDRFFPKFKSSKDLSNSYRIGTDVCNLWLDQSIDKKSLLSFSNTISNI